MRLEGDAREPRPVAPSRLAQAIATHAGPRLRPPVSIRPLSGLGDMIFCAGGIRWLAAYHERVIVHADGHHLASVAYLFADLGNVHVLPAESGHLCPDVPHLAMDLNGGYRERLEPVELRQLGLPWELSWTGFYLPRDWAAEGEILAALDIADGEPFAFVHDDPSRGFGIDPARLDAIAGGLRIVHPGGAKARVHPWPMPAWLGVLERAVQVHCIESSFAALVDRCPSVAGALHFHRYPRQHATERLKATRRRWWQVHR